MIRYGCCYFLAVALIGMTAGPVLAVTDTWTGIANGNWSNGANWDIGIPVAGDSLVFANTGQANVRADFSSYPETDPQAFDQPALHLESTTFALGAPAYTIELYTSKDSLIYEANVTSPKMYISRPLGLDGKNATAESIIPVDWHEISRGGSTATNYHLMPRDRLIIATEPPTWANISIMTVIGMLSRVIQYRL